MYTIDTDYSKEIEEIASSYDYDYDYFTLQKELIDIIKGAAKVGIDSFEEPATKN